MAELTKQALQVQNNTEFPNNNAGLITPTRLRTFNSDMIDSLVDEISYNIDSASFNSRINAITGSTVNTGSLLTTASFNAYTQSNDAKVNSLIAATASYATSAITASSLITASFDNGTRNLTFTKGDATTFAVNIPDVSGSTGNFATTGSNTFIGTQTISGSVLPLVDGQGDLGTDSQKWNKIVVNGELKGSSLNVNGRSSLGTARFSDETFPLSFLTDREIVADGSGVNTHMYYGTGSAVSALREFVYTTSGSNADFEAVSASFNTRINNITGSGGSGSIDTGSFATTGSNVFVGNQTVTGSLFISGNINMVNGADIVTHHVRAQGSNGLELQTSAGTIIVSMGAGGGTQATFVGAVSANSVSASTINGLGDPLTFSTSVDSRLDNLEGASGNYATLGANTFTGSQSISNASLNINNTGSAFFTITAGTQGNIIYDSPATVFTSKGTFNFNNNGGAGGSGSLQFTAASASINLYARDGIILGRAEPSPVGNGFVKMNTISGSLVLAPSGFNNTAADLLHLSSSCNTNNVNLIFKNSNTTADTIISGSNNIFANPTAPTAGFKRYMTGGNIAIGGSGAAVPQISGSMAFSPTIANNYFGVSANPLTIRGPVSSSAYTINNNLIVGGAINLGTSAANNFEKVIVGLNMTNNILAGNINAVASKTQLSASVAIGSNNIVGAAVLNMDSSSISLNGNTIQGQLTVNNSYFPATTGSQLQSSVNGGLYIGSHTIFLSGSNTTFTGPNGRSIANSAMIGNTNVISASLNGDLAQVNSTTLIGQGLVVVGTNSRQVAATAADWGSVFVGRWNSTDGTKDLTAETVFAVGTGTAEASRKTAFLIDSGSNSFFEGTLNVSGSTTITGSLILSSSAAIELQVIGNSVFTGSVAGNVVSASITSNTASIDFNLGNYFEITSSVTPLHLNVTNITPGRTSTLIVSASASSSITFSPNVAQPSGSAYSGSLGSIDILSLVAFNTSKVNLVATKALV
jgi:hypothetical protein